MLLLHQQVLKQKNVSIEIDGTIVSMRKSTCL